MSAPTIGALFAGYGGLELAAEQVWPGARTAWVAQHDPDDRHQYAARILAHRWPGAPNHGDVTRVPWGDVEPVDIITGGSPCQDLSTAGKRQGMRAGTRSGLWAAMTDAIDTIRPRLVIWENVRGALSAPAASASDLVRGPGPMGDRDGGHLRALGRVLGDLAELGYDAAWTGLRAADVGACHGRWRVFVTAWPQGDATALTWPQGDATALLPTPVVNDMGASYDPESWDAWTERMRAAHGNGNGHGASLHIEALRMLPTPTVSDANGAGEHGDGGAEVRTTVSLLPTPVATDANGARNATTGRQEGSQHHAGTTLSDVAHEDRWREYGPAVTRHETAFGRPAPEPTAPAGDAWVRRVIARRKSQVPVGMRGSIRFMIDGPQHRLSPRFVEWMMGLPDGHVTDVPGIPRNAQLKALGNGVVPRQAAAGVTWGLGVLAQTEGVAA
jgi:DNA (cytosine-5)-methyltransferase 1